MTSNIDRVLHRALDTLRTAEARALPETLQLSEALQLDFDDIDISFDERELFEDLTYGRDDEESELPAEAAPVRKLPLELS